MTLSNESTFQCGQCDKRFTRGSDLNSHIMPHNQCVAIFQAGQKAVIEKLCKAVLGRGVWGAKPPTVHTFFPLKKMLLHVILGIFLNLMRKKKETKNV